VVPARLAARRARGAEALSIATRLALAATAIALVLPAGAGAITIGQADPAPAGKSFGRCDYVGVFYVGITVPPGGGTVTSWSVADNPAGSKFALLVVQQIGDGFTTIVSHTQVRTVKKDGAKNTFAAHMAVKGGQFLALRVPERENFPSDCFYPSDGRTQPNGDMYANEGALVFGDAGPLPDGGHGDPHGSYPGARVNLEAKLNPPHACIVPNVLAKSLGAARRLLRRGHCRAGTVHGRHRHGPVMRQSPDGGAVLRWDARVTLWLDKH
jgi:hypothetical protein